MGYIYRGYIGIMEKKMEATVLYWGSTGIVESHTLRSSRDVEQTPKQPQQNCYAEEGGFIMGLHD